MKKILLYALMLFILCGCTAREVPVNPQTEPDITVTEEIKEPEQVQTEVQKEEIPVKHTPVCTVSINCKTIEDNIDKLEESKRFLVPTDGIILPETTIEIQQGDTAFDILKRITRQKGIHMEFSETPMYNSAYIEGINNLYEFDCGESSGWIYTINDETLSYSSSKYTVKDGDNIKWIYTLDLGRDIQSN